MNSLEAWEAPALLCSRLRASLVTLWLSAQNRTVPKNTHTMFLSSPFLSFSSASSYFLHFSPHWSPSSSLHQPTSFSRFRYFSPATSALSSWVTVCLRASFLVTTPLLFYSSDHTFFHRSPSLLKNLFPSNKPFQKTGLGTVKHTETWEMRRHYFLAGIWIIAFYYHKRFIWFVGCQAQP